MATILKSVTGTSMVGMRRPRKIIHFPRGMQVGRISVKPASRANAQSRAGAHWRTIGWPINCSNRRVNGKKMRSPNSKQALTVDSITTILPPGFNARNASRNAA